MWAAPRQAPDRGAVSEAPVYPTFFVKDRYSPEVKGIHPELFQYNLINKRQLLDEIIDRNMLFSESHESA